jgi:ribosomal silencing factor RsfS
LQLERQKAKNLEKMRVVKIAEIVDDEDKNDVLTILTTKRVAVSDKFVVSSDINGRHTIRKYNIS